MRKYSIAEDDDDEKSSLLSSNSKGDKIKKNINLSDTKAIGENSSLNGASEDLSQQQPNVNDDSSSLGDAEDPLRNFDINKSKVNGKLFQANKIKTSKYTPLTFLPKNLSDQFSKLANIYFLVILILQIIPAISITSGTPTMLPPLIIVIAISAAKDLFEDLKRHKSDKVENNRSVHRYDKKRRNFVEDTWQNLKVGQIVMIKQDQFFPADMIMLRSSNPAGIAFVETKNLDGETSLKHKYALKEFQSMLQTPEALAGFQGHVQCEAPNDNLYKFEGIVTLSSNQSTLSLDHNNLLLRGTSLKNTEFIYGLTVFTGHDSKIMKNQIKARTKFSKVEIQTNRHIIFIFLMQIVVCSICAALNIIWTLGEGTKHGYLGLTTIGEQSSSIHSPDNVFLAIIFQFVLRFGTWVLLLCNFVPISLMVTLEMVKFLQSWFISWDIEIYDQEKDLPTKVQTSNLNEQLGQVDFVFTDKTGTLTCNKMDFKKFCVDKYSYGNDNAKCLDAEEKGVTNFNFEDETLFRHLGDDSHPNHKNLDNFITNLAVCHTVIAEQKDQNTLVYEASSPDELALVNAAKYFGYFFKGRDQDNRIEISVNGQTLIYHLLNVIEFTSERRRMTVIVRTPDNKIKVLMKGADNVIFSRLSSSKRNLELEHYVQQYIVQYATLGLRTLLFSEKEISEEVYQQFNQQFQMAICSINKREERINEVADQFEKDFELIGATAIEDQLQDEVDLTITSMKKGGMKVWMLTGDKVETSINIGFSCKLLNQDMELYVINGQSKSECLAQIAECRSQQITSEGLRQGGTIVAGDSLFKIMSSERLTKQFLRLACSSSAVIVCRMTPKQKADIVALIQKYAPEAVTLAIGDGANDVNMINTAHIGIGIQGLEGAQAANTSDFAIAQFKYMRQLLFIHGRESYRKNSHLVCYIFFKNILFVMPFVWFGYYSAFSGQVFYEQWIFTFYNVCYTALPIVAFALYDMQFPKNEFLTNPKLYRIGPSNQCFDTWIFWKWILYGIALSFLVFYVSFFTFNASPSHFNGQVGEMWLEGTFCYAAIVIFANMNVLTQSFSHTKGSIIITFLSIGFFFFSVWFFSTIGFSTMDDQWFELHTYPTYYFNLILFFFALIPIDSFLAFIQRTRKDWQLQREKEKYRKAKKNFNKGLDPDALPLLHKHSGFAFSIQEPLEAQQQQYALQTKTSRIK